MTARDVAVGEELTIRYGAMWWIEMLAAARLDGTTFQAAWAANQLLFKGDENIEASVKRES